MAEYMNDVWSTEAREIMPGFRGHFVHSEHTIPAPAFSFGDDSSAFPAVMVKPSRMAVSMVPLPVVT